MYVVIPQERPTCQKKPMNVLTSEVELQGRVEVVWQTIYLSVFAAFLHEPQISP